MFGIVYSSVVVDQKWVYHSTAETTQLEKKVNFSMLVVFK